MNMFLGVSSPSIFAVPGWGRAGRTSIQSANTWREAMWWVLHKEPQVSADPAGRTRKRVLLCAGNRSADMSHVNIRPEKISLL